MSEVFDVLCAAVKSVQLGVSSAAAQDLCTDIKGTLLDVLHVSTTYPYRARASRARLLVLFLVLILVLGLQPGVTQSHAR